MKKYMKKFMAVIVMVLAMASLASAGNRVKLVSLELAGWSEGLGHYDSNAVSAIQATVAPDAVGAVSIDSDVFTAESLRAWSETPVFEVPSRAVQGRRVFYYFAQLTAQNQSELTAMMTEFVASMIPPPALGNSPPPLLLKRQLLALYKNVADKPAMEQVIFNYLSADGTINPVWHRAFMEGFIKGSGDFANTSAAGGLVGARTDSILAAMVAPEFSMTQADLDFLKAELKKRAVVGARKTLRSQGKSFVSYEEVVGGVTNIVNPIDAVIAPVVDALNAAELAGIELAYAGIGITVVPLNRAGFTDPVIVSVKTKIMDGELIGTEDPRYFPKLVLLLGVDGFNAFVEAYNKGTK